MPLNLRRVSMHFIVDLSAIPTTIPSGRQKYWRRATFPRAFPDTRISSALPLRHPLELLEPVPETF